MSLFDLSVVLLHGHGGSPVSYEDIAASLSGELGCAVVVPAGPMELADGRAWWDAPDEGPGAEAVGIVSDAVASVVSMGGRVALVGFSQGAAMAAALANLESVAAVVMVAGFAPEPTPDDPVGVPVLSLYGEHDEAVDPFLSQRAGRWMARRGADVEEMSHTGGHEWSDEVNTIVAGWLRTVCAPTG